MPRPKRCEVVVRARGERELVLAAVARAGVDVADRERAGRGRAAGRPSVAAEAAEVAEQGRASAVRAGVAELEALVDEREVGQQVVRRRRARRTGQLAYEPVRRRSRADAVAVALDDADRRAARALDAADADRALGAARGAAAAGASGRVEQRRRGGRRSGSSSSARCSSRALHVAGGRVADAPARSRRRRAAGSSARDVLGDAGGARGRPDGAERARVVGASRTPMSGSRSWNEALKSELAPAARRVGAQIARARRARAAPRSRRASSALPPTRDGAEQEAVAGERAR